MPAVRPLPPSAIRKLLEAKGYKLIASDDFNCAYALGETDEPIVVPITVSLVPLEVAFHIAQKVGFNNYFEALHALPDQPYPPDEEASSAEPPA
jgi:hypothetical protein